MSNEIADAFGIDTPTQYPTKELTSEVVDEVKDKLQERLKQNIDKDYDYVRKNLTSMIESSMELIPNLVDVVQQSESPRMYESASAFMKMIAELNKDLISTSKELEKGAAKAIAAPVSTPQAPQGETNIFIGTSADVFSRLGKRKTQVQELEELPVINS